MESRNEKVEKNENVVQLKRTTVPVETTPLGNVAAVSDQPNTKPISHVTPKEDLEFDPEALISEAQEIKERILLLNKRRQENELLKVQYDHFINGKLSLGCATYEFAELVKDYEKIIPKYEALCDTIVKSNIMTSKDIKEIENAGKVQSQQFFPALQLGYDKKLAEYTKEKNEIVNPIKAKLTKSEKEYTDRSDVYYGVHATTGVLSLCFQPAYPFFMGSLIVHAVDNIITSLKNFLLKKKINRAEEAFNIKKEELDKDMELKIEDSSPLTQFKQSFFSLAKEKQQTHLTELAEKAQQHNVSFTKK